MIKNFPLMGASQPTTLWRNSERLDSWKEIASYLRREVRTVQLWEKKEGLPVHRHFHKRLGSVYALRSEIDEWKRKVSREEESQTSAIAAKNTEPRTTIYVLPLNNIVGNFKRVSQADLIVEKTIVGLEQLNPAQLNVIRPKSPIQQKERESTICRNTDGKPITYLLRWTVQDDGKVLRLNVALLSADTDVVTWTQTYECVSNDSTTAQNVADQVVQCLWLKIFSSTRSYPVGKHRERPASREAYLKGRYFWNQRDEGSLRKALHFFESAIQEDPQFALAYSGLADSLTLLSFYEIVSPFEAMPSARRAALKSIELDPNLAEAHVSLADVLLHFDRNLEAADHEYRRAIQCNPDYALGYHWYANLLSAKGQHEAAHMAIMHALEIDPVSIITLVWAGVTAHLAHRFDEAIKHYQSALELDPHFIWAHMYMAQALEQKGKFREALGEFETTIRLAGGSNCVKAMKAHAHAVAGDKSTARAILHELKAAASYKCMPSYDIAATYTALGEPHHAILWLNRACEDRNMKLFTLTQDPRFDRLRLDSEFKEIVEQVGLTR
jgi:tetratricopeptide (TPR) repeat protein